MSLSHSWNLYEHPPGTKSWALDSYRKVHEFKSVHEIASMIKTITLDSDLVSGAYLCFMKDDIPPIYESEANKNGGALTIRVPTENAHNIWSTFVSHIVTDDIFHKSNDVIAGLIISPKRGNIIIQIWTTEKVEPSVVNPILSNLVGSEILYRSHYERI